MAFGSGPTRTLGLKLEADVSDAAAKLNSVDGKLGGFKSAIKSVGATVAAEVRGRSDRGVRKSPRSKPRRTPKSR